MISQTMLKELPIMLNGDTCLDTRWIIMIIAGGEPELCCSIDNIYSCRRYAKLEGGVYAHPYA